MRNRFSILLASFLAAACGDGGTAGGADAAVPDGGADATASDTVTGTASVIHVTADGETAVATDLSAATVAALVPAGDGFDELAGSGDSDGVFVIDGVPEGPYYLRLDGTYYHTSSRTLELGGYAVGRADAAAPGEPTILSIEAAGLSPWQDADMLLLFDPQSGAYEPALHGLAVAGAPGAGDEALAGLELDLALARVPRLIDGAAGDAPLIVQYAWTEDAGGPVQWSGEPVALLEPEPFAVTDGASATVTGSFAAVDADERFQLELDLDALDARTAEVHPDAEVTRTWFGLRGQAAGSDHGPFGPALDLVTLLVHPGQGGTLSRQVAHGNPKGWDSYGYVQRQYEVTIAPPSMPAFVAEARLYHADRLEALDEAVIAPPISPVREPAIDGEVIAGGRAGVGLTPTVTWTAPAVGGIYRIDVLELEPGDETTGRRRVARLWTDREQVTIPPGVLEQDRTYVLVIAAVSSPGIDTASPHRYGFPYAEASAVTGWIAP